MSNICKKLNLHHINPSPQEFMQTYREVASKYRRIRHSKHMEVSNRVLLTDTLNRLGYDLEATSPKIGEAVKAYFDPWMLTLYADTRETLSRLRESHRIGLISNFTDTAFLSDSLSNLELDEYFECVLVSDDVGWRKPHPHIFKRFLASMNVEPNETLFIGDDLECDIQGAKGVDMKTAWIVRSLHQTTIQETGVRPDYIIHSLSELEGILQE